jgi:AbrB family looped-hinge helix DNA binding protein
MPTVKLHPEGWLSLPDAVRRKLGVESGDTLEVQVVGNSAILRPAKGKAASAEPEAAAEETAPSSAEAETPAPAKRRGRPPKVRG